MISIIIPLYNKEAIIECTLRSVLSQDYDDYEVIIVDDGSTDNSAAIAKRFIDSLSPSNEAVRWTVIEQENGGPSKARNTGVKNSIGDWLYFIDADDEMESGCLSHFANIVNEHPEVDMFLGEVSLYNGKTKFIVNQYKEGVVKNIFKNHFLGCTFQCSGSSLYKRIVCEQFMYNEHIRRYEDLECLFRRYRECSIYLMHYPVAIINCEYASASNGRRDIKEDFLGHIDFKGKSFWEKMCLYQLFLGERPHYPEQCRKLYPSLYKRFDLYFIYQFLSRTKRLWA